MIELTDSEKRELLKLSRKVLENELKNENNPLKNDNAKFDKKRGVFVTIKNKQNLRGCIGYIKPIDTIWNSVIKMTKSAAFNDPRFSSVKKDELSDLDIEISVLSKLIQIEDVESIKVGRDGLLIQKGYNSGVLLPQVATKNNWNAETFLENTCWKAGLGKNCYEKEDTDVFRFEAEV